MTSSTPDAPPSPARSSERSSPRCSSSLPLVYKEPSILPNSVRFELIGLVGYHHHLCVCVCLFWRNTGTSPSPLASRASASRPSSEEDAPPDSLSCESASSRLPPIGPDPTPLCTATTLRRSRRSSSPATASSAPALPPRSRRPPASFARSARTAPRRSAVSRRSRPESPRRRSRCALFLLSASCAIHGFSKQILCCPRK